jgi:hypothetical protein
MKTRSLHQVRHYPTATAYSVGVGFKQRLLPFQKARRVVSRLRRSGVDAFSTPVRVSV